MGALGIRLVERKADAAGKDRVIGPAVGRLAVGRLDVGPGDVLAVSQQLKVSQCQLSRQGHAARCTAGSTEFAAPDGLHSCAAIAAAAAALCS